MWTMLLGLLALAPVAALLFFIYNKDHDPEPFRTVAITFLWGCLTPVPAILLEMIPMPNAFMECFFVIAPAEEVCKMTVVMLYIWKHKDFDDSFDAIVYCVMASLGFAAIENLLYVFQNGLMVALMRAITSIPGHTAFAVFMGYFIGRAKTHFYYGRTRKKVACLAAAFMSAVAVHGTYDFLLSDADFFGGFIFFVLAMDVAAFVLVRKAAKDDRPMIIDL